jgi:hypothetical protein
MRCEAILLLALLFLAVSVSADPVRIWTDNKEYTFPVGVEAKIPLHVENNAGAEVTGVFRASLTDVAEGQEARRWIESRTYAFAPGESTIVFPAGTSQDPLVRLIRLDFDYTAGMARTLSLDELSVRFVVTDSGSTSSQASGPGVEAIPGVAEPPSSVVGGGANLVEGTTPVAAQATQDMESLQRDLQASQEETARQKETLHTSLVQSPAFVTLNETLVSAGYTSREPVINPDSDADGGFTVQYTGAMGTILLQGTIEGGVVTTIEASSSSSLPVPPEFTNNTNYRDHMTSLAGEGFTPAGSRITISGNELTLEAGFTGKEGERAVLTAVSRNGVIQSVNVEKDSGIIDVPSLAALIVLLAALALVLGLNHRKRTALAEAEESHIIIPQTSPDPAATALEMIAEARITASQGDLPTAYRRAGHALRFLISHRYGTGAEITDTEALTLLQDAGSPWLPTATRILLRCREVGFAQDKASAGEFEMLAGDITNLAIGL